MLSLHESMDSCPRPSGPGSVFEEPRRTRGKRRTRYVLCSLVLGILASVVGCGDEKSSPEAKEDMKQKQQVVQEKMKEYMQKKAKMKGPGR